MFTDKWRILELDYHCRILGYLLSLIDQQSWRIDEIPVAEIFELLDELLPSKILMHLVSMYIIDSSSQSNFFCIYYALEVVFVLNLDKCEIMYVYYPLFFSLLEKLGTSQQLGKLNTDLVNRTLGHWFLKTCRQMEFNEFMKTWKETNPLGMRHYERSANVCLVNILIKFFKRKI